MAPVPLMPELRKDPLIGRWVIISTDRAKRPMDFAPRHITPTNPSECPFCEGHESHTQPEVYAIRSPGHHHNSPGWSVRVVPSFKPVLRIEGELRRRANGMYDVMPGIGAHEIIIEDPKHAPNMADLSVERIEQALAACAHRMQDLGRDARFRYALWFKNYGAVAGAGRIDHARSQLIATPVTPKRVKDELAMFQRYFEDKERCLACDMISQELDAGVRVVLDSPHFVAICPFASRFPFELCVLPKRHHHEFQTMTADERKDLASVMRQVLRRLRAMLNDPPYNYVLHTAPFRQPARRSLHWRTLEDDYHWHLELIPRLTRVAGFEWGSGFYINQTPPEEAAKYLRDAGDV